MGTTGFTCPLSVKKYNCGIIFINVNYNNDVEYIKVCSNDYIKIINSEVQKILTIYPLIFTISWINE